MPTASVSNDAQRLSAWASPHGVTGASRDPQGDAPQQAVQGPQDSTRVTLSARAQELAAAQSDQTAGQDQANSTNGDEADSRHTQLLRAYDGHA